MSLALLLPSESIGSVCVTLWSLNHNDDSKYINVYILIHIVGNQCLIMHLKADLSIHNPSGGISFEKHHLQVF